MSSKHNNVGTLKAFKTPHSGIHKAAYDGDLDRVLEFINISAKGTDTWGTGVAPVLVSNVLSRDSLQATPLHHAAFMGHDAIVELLLCHGAEPDARDIDGCTPLHNACFNGKKSTASILLDHTVDGKKSVDIDSRDVDGNCALHKAAYNGHTIVCKLLLDYKANLELVENRGMSPLNKACSFGADASHFRCISLLLDNGANVNATDFTLSTPLHRSAYKGNPKIVKALIEDGASLSPQDREGYTPLHYAAYNGNYECVKVLLDEGAEPSPFSNVLVSLQSDKDKSADSLNNNSNRSSDLRLSSPRGTTPLHLAAGRGHLHCVKLLVKHKCILDYREGKRLRSALHYAAWRGHVDVVNYLIKAGADVNLKDYKGFTPLDLANKKHNHIDEDENSEKNRDEKNEDKNSEKLNDNGRPKLTLKKHFKYHATRSPTESSSPISITTLKGTSKERNKKLGGSLSDLIAKTDHIESPPPQHAHRRTETEGAALPSSSQQPQHTEPKKQRKRSFTSPDTNTKQTPNHETQNANDNNTNNYTNTNTLPNIESITLNDKNAPRGESTSNSSNNNNSSPSTPHSLSPSSDSVVIQVDRYGFVGNGFIDSEQILKREINRSQKWDKMMKKWYKHKSSNRMKGRLLKGIPDCVRGTAWKLLLHTNEKPKDPKYQTLVHCATPHLDQINKDLSRTFPKHILFRDKGSMGQSLLCNVLTAYSVLHPEIGYCQGMGFLSALLLMYMEEEDAFWGLVRLLSDYGIEGLYTDDMRSLPEVVKIHDELIMALIPNIGERLESKGVMTLQYAPQWYITLYLYTLPFSLVLRIWDVFLNEGTIFIFLIAIALLKLSEENLMKFEFEDMSSYLNFTGGDNESQRKGKKFVFPLDPDTLIKAAMGFRHKQKVKLIIQAYPNILKNPNPSSSNSNSESNLKM